MIVPEGLDLHRAFLVSAGMVGTEPHAYSSMGYVSSDAAVGEYVLSVPKRMTSLAEKAHWNGIGRLIAELCVADVMAMAGEQWTTGRFARWLPFVNTQLVRFCPQCVREGRPFANAWLLEPITACTVHQVQLCELWTGAAQHTEARGPFNPYTWRSLLKWPQARENMALRGAQPATDAELRMSSFVESLLGGPPSHSGYPQELNQMLPLEALRLVRFLGLHGDGIACAKPLKVARTRVLHQSRRAGEATDLAFFKWPANMGHYLASLTRVLDPVREAPRLRDLLGPFYDYVFREFSDGTFLFLRREVGRHLMREYLGLIDERHKRLLSVASINEAPYVSGKEAAASLGVSYDALLRLIKYDLVPGHVLKRHDLAHMRVLVAKSDLKRIGKVSDSLITATEAREMLCLSRRQMDSLTATPVLEYPSTAHAEGQVLLAKRVHWITMTLERDAQTGAAPEDAVGLQRIGDKVGKGGFAQVVCALFEGELPFWRTHQDSPLRVLVRLDDVRAWRRRERQRAVCGLRTVPELSQEHKIKQEVLYHVIRVGLLPAQLRRVGFREERLVRDEDMHAFLRDYTTLGRKGFSKTAWAHRRLAEQGIHPVTGPNVDGCRQYFYRNDLHLGVALDTLRREAAARRGAVL